ncbi:MAG: type II toxin-antitoxin system RelE/ParE family toxin [Pseudomonadota bacterium]
MLISFHPEAGAEIIEAAQFYEAREPGLGIELLKEAQLLIDRIAANPSASTKIGRRARWKSFRRFPYNIVYVPHPDRIRIVAFAHQKRHPFYWRKRLMSTAEDKGPTLT